MKKKISLLLAIACVASLAVGSLAYFTDRVEASATATAGTLDLTLSEITAVKPGSATPTQKYKPGEGIKIGYTLANAGNKSADVLETLVLTSTVAMTGNSDPVNPVTCEFELYAASDVDVSSKGLVSIHDGAKPLTVRSVSDDKMKVTYALPEFILNGTGENHEEEPGAVGVSKTGDYVLVFKNSSGNAFQNVTLTLDYEAQAKQHRNTDKDTWAIVKSETVTFAGNNAHAVVPVKAAG